MNLPAAETPNISLSLTRVINAPPERVFKAWTDPAFLNQWFGPKGVDTSDAVVDLRVGGNYRLTMREPNGAVITHGGEYREIKPPEKLVFTWVLDGQSCSGSEGQYAETVVTLHFEDLGSSTRLTLTHEFLPSQTSKENHYMGWEGSLECLEEVLT